MAEPKDQDEERRKEERERDRARNRSGPRPPPKAQSGVRATGLVGRDVPQEVEELIAAVAAEAQPQLEARQPAGAAAGLPALALSGPLRAIALQVLEVAAARAGQQLADYVRDHRDDLLAKLPSGLVTLLSALLEQVGPARGD